jgi:hypothetical protein
LDLQVKELLFRKGKKPIHTKDLQSFEKESEKSLTKSRVKNKVLMFSKSGESSKLRELDLTESKNPLSTGSRENSDKGTINEIISKAKIVNNFL